MSGSSTARHSHAAHRRASSTRATVAAQSTEAFMRCLDTSHRERVGLEELLAFTAKHCVQFEQEGAPCVVRGEGLPPSLEEQHRAVLSDMLREAAALRAPTLFVKEAAAALTECPTLELADLTAALSLRPSLGQSPRGSEIHVTARSRYRRHWLRLLLCVVPSPFEPSQYDVHAGKGYLSARSPGANPHPLPSSMFEREAAHAVARRAEYTARRSSAPTSGPFNPSVTLHDPPTARSAAESYRFTQPSIKIAPLPLDLLQARAAKEEAKRIEEEKEWNPKQRRLKQLARALATSARTYELQHENEDETEFTGTRRADDEADTMSQPSSDALSPSPFTDAALARLSSDDLSSAKLDCITFRTKDTFRARVEAMQAKSDALEYRPDAQKHLLSENGGDESSSAADQALADRLMESLMGGSKGSGPKPPSAPPQGTARERVAAALAAQRKTYSTSGKFKPRATTGQSAAATSAALQRHADGSMHPRWINANAPDASENNSARQRQKEIVYDDQGRPILPARRHAMDRHYESTQSSVPVVPQRLEWDRAQAQELCCATERNLEAQPVRDPLEKILAPFVIPEVLPREIEALEKALEETPFVASASRASAAAPGDSEHLPRSGSSSARRPPFILDFPQRSPQDERRYASTHLTCFHSQRGEASISNGGITALRQLRADYIVPSATEEAQMQMLDRDASVGDLSLLPRHSPRLRLALVRMKLDAQRPKFRMDWHRRPLSTVAGGSDIGECDVITRDGGATTAAQGEKWRLEQLGFTFRGTTTRRPASSGAAAAGSEEEQKEAPELRAQTARLSHTRGVMVHRDHLRPGAHTVRHAREFTTLGASLGPPPKPLHVSEHEAALIENGQGAALRAAQERERRASERAKMRPSERNKIEEAAARSQRLQHFPFVPAPPEESKTQH